MRRACSEFLLSQREARFVDAAKNSIILFIHHGRVLCSNFLPHSLVARHDHASIMNLAEYTLAQSLAPQ
jgi:hypothetical protein